MDTAVIAIGAVSLVALLFDWMSRTKSTRLPLPPGPPPIPFLGNALDIDTTQPHVTYAQWGKQYGEIVYSRLLGQDYIIVNSEKVARALSDARRSVVYADRPRLSIYKLLGVESSTGPLPYGDAWRMHRRLFHQTLRSDTIIKYQHFFMSKAISLVQDLLQDGAASNLGAILQSFSATTTLSLTYGHNINSLNHPTVKLVEGLNEIVVKEGTPERAALLQTFPFVKYLPSWFPGLGFLERAATCRQLAEDVWTQPFEHTKNQVAAGTAPQSMVADFLINNEEDQNSERYRELEALMKAAAATVYMAGADTTSATLHTFILAMVLFPEVQEKAQAEIDSVVGRDRLPTFADRDALPYVEAIICETMRWHPVVLLGIPHATSEDDEYRGFHIPKGATIIFNAWAMSRDCVSPDQFDPGRHLLPTGELSPTARMTANFGFGFGRRVCPGRFLADTVLWAAFVQILATLRFLNAQDADGKPIEVTPVFIHGIASRPAPFQLTITATERRLFVNK